MIGAGAGAAAAGAGAAGAAADIVARLSLYTPQKFGERVVQRKMDGRIIRHASVSAAHEAALNEVKTAMVAVPNALNPVDSEDDHQPQWQAVRKALPDIVEGLFVAMMRATATKATGEDARAYESTVTDHREQITKLVRSWRRRVKQLSDVKTRDNTAIVATEDRRRYINSRINRLNTKSHRPPSAKEHAAEVVHQRACDRLRDHRKKHLTALAEAHAFELKTYSGKTFGFGVACIRFLAVLRKHLLTVANEHTAMLEDLRRSAEVGHPERAAKCQALKAKFFRYVYEPTLRLLEFHGFSPEELRVAVAVYSDVEDADPFCVQRCSMIEVSLSRLLKVPEKERDEQAAALEQARRSVQELRATAHRLQKATAKALEEGNIGSLRTIQAREASVNDALAKAEADVENISHQVAEAPQSPEETPKELLERLRGVREACKSVKAAVESASRVPEVVARMAQDQRVVSSRKLLDAAVANVRAGKASVCREFDAADRDHASLMANVNRIAEDITVVETARAAYEPETYNNEEVAIYALRIELASVEASLHSLHVKRLGTMSMLSAAQWIVNEGTRLLSKK